MGAYDGTSRARQVRGVAWHPTASVRRRAVKAGVSSWQLMGTVHARHLGSLLTACGSHAPDWPMLLDRHFDPHDAEACKLCLESLRRPRT